MDDQGATQKHGKNTDPFFQLGKNNHNHEAFETNQ